MAESNRALQEIGRRIKTIQASGKKLHGLYVNEDLWAGVPKATREYGCCLIAGVRVGKAEVHPPHG